MRPDAFARAAEERGFESIWFAEHSHIPVSPATPGPPEPGQPGLPREYYAVADPFVALALAAAATERLRIATGICLVPQRDVFQTAKQVASLDLYSNGRFLFGVGGGWNRPEIADHGVDPDRALRRDARAHRGDEAALDGGARRVPRRARRLRPQLRLAEAAPEAASARARRRRRPARDPPRGALRRRLGTADGAAATDDPIALLPHLREAARRGGTRCGALRGVDLLLSARPGRGRALPRGRHHAACSSRRRRGPRATCARCSTATRS